MDKKSAGRLHNIYIVMEHLWLFWYWMAGLLFFGCCQRRVGAELVVDWWQSFFCFAVNVFVLAGAFFPRMYAEQRRERYVGSPHFVQTKRCVIIGEWGSNCPFFICVLNDMCVALMLCFVRFSCPPTPSRPLSPRVASFGRWFGVRLFVLAGRIWAGLPSCEGGRDGSRRGGERFGRS